MSKSDYNNPKVDSLPSYKEDVTQKPKEAQERLSAEELKSHTGEMPNTFLALKQLEDVQKNLEQARGLFAGTTSKALSGVEKLEFEKAGEAFEKFMSSFEKLRTFADSVDHKKPLDSLNNSLTLTGRLKDFAKDQLMKVEKIFEGSANAVKNNPILNAVGNVIKSACHAGVGTIAKGTLNNAIATGELAKSVVNLGVAIKNSIVGKGVKQATRGV
ncbi:hypothetical protein [Candidatus Tisiphia endosymbiont of Empis tessellata]|uniref:hypothetical protein n=1 Tax=Candidatus Tisiphia endosymbiont of Empis tessellata TaxID=3066259 RepID=UPI00313D9B8E